jgi:hypothetical protein
MRFNKAFFSCMNFAEQKESRDRPASNSKSANRGTAGTSRKKEKRKRVMVLEALRAHAVPTLLTIL